MNIKKTVLSTATGLAVIATLTACGGGNVDTPSATAAPSSASANTAAADPQSEPSESQATPIEPPACDNVANRDGLPLGYDEETTKRLCAEADNTKTLPVQNLKIGEPIRVPIGDDAAKAPYTLDIIPGRNPVPVEANPDLAKESSKNEIALVNVIKAGQYEMLLRLAVDGNITDIRIPVNVTE